MDPNPAQPPRPIRTAPADLLKELGHPDVWHVNTGQRYMTLSEDRIKVCLMEHLDKTKDRVYGAAGASAFVAILLAFVTSSPHGFLFITGPQWTMVFGAIALVDVLFMWRGLRSIRHHITIDDLIDELRTGSITYTGVTRTETAGQVIPFTARSTGSDADDDQSDADTF